jgi:hypothetical protein
MKICKCGVSICTLKTFSLTLVIVFLGSLQLGILTESASMGPYLGKGHSQGLYPTPLNFSHIRNLLQLKIMASREATIYIP